MIDVHILTLPERANWLAECLASLKDQPVNIHVIPGIRGHVGQGRIQGYSQGTAEWVSSVDDDDRVLPGAFERITRLLQQYPQADALFTNEERIDVDGTVMGNNKSEDRVMVEKGFSLLHHHLQVYRRRELMPYLESISDKIRGSDSYLSYQFIKDHQVICDFMVGYQWRQHTQQWHKGVV